MTRKLLYRCKWTNECIPTIRIYFNKGKFIATGGSYFKRREMTTTQVLNEISSTFNSKFGYTKISLINTEVFKLAFGSDNIMKVFKREHLLK